MSLESIYSEAILQSGVTPMRRVKLLALRLHDGFASITTYILQIWLILFCILLEALSLIFLGGGNIGFTITVSVLLIILMIFLCFEFMLELVIHGIYHYF